jgi:hypothetical protein
MQFSAIGVDRLTFIWPAAGSPPVAPPTAAYILAPSDGSTVVAGTTVTFTGGGFSGPSVISGDALVWSSNLNGRLATGIAGATAADIVHITISPKPTLALPTAPSGLAATAKSSSEVDLAWHDNSDDETGFRIERCAGVGCSTFAQVAATSAGATAFQDRAVLGSSSYSYRIAATNAAGSSGYSNAATAVTPVAVSAPAAPTSLQGSIISQSQVKLSWTAGDANATDFYVEQWAGSGCANFSQICQVIVTTCNAIGLTPGTSYSYRVRAHNSGGFSAYSSVVNIVPHTVLPPPGIGHVSPNPVHGFNGQQSFAINGSYFQAGAVVVLRDVGHGGTYTKTPITLTALDITITANFTTTPSAWTVEVVNPDGQSSGPYPFNVIYP